MSHFVFILLVEVILVLSVSLIVLMIFNWNKKKQNAAEIERLLGQVEENDITRKKHLVNYLTNQLSMEEQPAVELVEDFIAAEKRFTQQFLEIQLNRQPVSGFYQHSYEFVDKHLQLIAENVPKAINNGLDITGDVSPEEKSDTNNSEEVEEINKEKDTEPKNMDEASEDSDNNEANQTPSTEAEPIEETDNSEGAEDEFSEEPDWEDAFAEAGVEIDESSSEENAEDKN